MFRTAISSSPFVGRIADASYKRISTINEYGGDHSLITTARALIYPRMGENDTLNVSYFRRRKLSSDEDMYGFNSLWFFDITDTNSYDESVENFKNGTVGFSLLEKVTVFFQKTMKVKCFVNAETKSTVVFTECMDIRQYHYIQCALLVMVPWYYSGGSLDDKSLALIYSLRENESTKYMEAVNAMYNPNDAEREFTKELLGNIETYYYREEYSRVTSSIDELFSQYSSYLTRISEVLSKKDELETQKLGLKARIDSGVNDGEIMEYFLSNSGVHLVDVVGNTIEFVTTSNLVNFDSDEAESMINDDRSMLYIVDGHAMNNYIKHEDMKAVMKAIFVDRTLKMRVCAKYSISLSGGVNADKHFDYGIAYNTYTPNPHTDQYRCMGNYTRIIEDLLARHNIILAIEQCVASCGSLNFEDTTVMEEFVKRFYGTSSYTVNRRCIELPDGRIVDPNEAAEYLKSVEA